MSAASVPGLTGIHSALARFVVAVLRGSMDMMGTPLALALRSLAGNSAASRASRIFAPQRMIMALLSMVAGSKPEFW